MKVDRSIYGRAADFQFDVTTDGRPIKTVSIIDEHTRECLGDMVERNITGEDLICEGQRYTSTGLVPQGLLYRYLLDALSQPERVRETIAKRISKRQ